MSGDAWVLVVLAVLAVALLVLALARPRRVSSEAEPARPPVPAGGVPAGAAPSGPPESTATTPEPAAAPPGPAAATPEPAAAEPPAPPEPGPAAVQPAPADEATDPGLPVGPPPVPVPALASLDGGDTAGRGDTVGSGAAAVVAEDDTTEGPYPGSALPTADGSAPSRRYPIKANEGSRRYHDPGSPYFHRNRADVWFASAADAEAAGFVPWNGSRAPS